MPVAARVCWATRRALHAMPGTCSGWGKKGKRVRRHVPWNESGCLSPPSAWALGGSSAEKNTFIEYDVRRLRLADAAE